MSHASYCKWPIVFIFFPSLRAGGFLQILRPYWFRERGVCKTRTGYLRMADGGCGWENADRKMRMQKKNVRITKKVRGKKREMRMAKKKIKQNNL